MNLAVLREIQKELIPTIIVLVLLAAALRYWLADITIPDDLSTLVATVVAFYFGARTGASAATRALNGQAAAVTAAADAATVAGLADH